MPRGRMNNEPEVIAPEPGAITLPGEGPMPLASMGRRFPALDLLRVLAILTIITSHTLPGEMQARLWKDLPCNLCLGAMFVLSGALLLPMYGSVRDFFSKRLRRVLIPLAVWSVIYAAVYYFQGERTLIETLRSIRDILFRSTFPPGWFCYAIAGIYLFTPVISPWLRAAGRRQIEAYLLVWLLSLNIPYFGITTDINAGLFSMFYNCLGYSIAGMYLVHYAIPEPPSWRVWVPAVLFVTVYPLYTRLHNGWEAYSQAFYITPNCVEAALGIPLFVIIWKLFGGWKQTTSPAGRAARMADRLLRELSVDSFGLYLIHWLFVFHILYPYFPGWEPSWATYFLTIGVCYPAAALLRRIPVVGKYLM